VRWRRSRVSSPLLFAVGLINASLMSAAILPLATSYNICEGLGFESGIDRRFGEAKIFYGCTRADRLRRGIRADSGIAAVEGDSDFAGGQRHLLPFVLFFMLKLINRSFSRACSMRIAATFAITVSKFRSSRENSRIRFGESR
jgi:hypothetical protein